MTQKRKVYVMGIKSVNFNNDEGENIKGANVHYFDPDNYDKEEGQIPSRTFLRGGKEDIPLRHGNGLYNLVMDIVLAGNRPRLEVVGLEFIKKADIQIKEG